MAKTPKYRLHKGSKQAVCTIAGKDFYLGKHGSPGSKQRYHRLLAEWEASQNSPILGCVEEQLTIKQLVAANLKYMRTRLGTEKNSEYHRIKPAFKTLVELYGDTAANVFGPAQFKAARIGMCDGKRSRQYVNSLAKRIRALFKWATSEGLVPVTIHQTLATIPSLRIGEANAPESKRVLPIDDATVEKTLPHPTPVVADMVRVQRLTGCSPGEICQLAPAMIDRSKDVWVAVLAKHKTANRGKSRGIYIDPKAQEFLRPYLQRGADQAFFSPAESEEKRRAAKSANRKTPLNQGNKPGYSKRIREGRKLKQTSNECFAPDSYGRSMKYACKKAGVAPWSPNQLRHSVATDMRAQFGLDAAQAILGHSSIGVTQVYAEANHAKGIEVARRIG